MQGDHVIVTALKQAQEGEDLILRLYECEGKAGRVALQESEKRGVSKLWKSNILEGAISLLDPKSADLVPIAPWEILSLRLQLAPRGGEVADWKQ